MAALRSMPFYVLYIRSLLSSQSKDSKALNTIKGSIACIALSLIPLVCILIMTDGMIEGIKERLAGLGAGDIEVHFNSSVAIDKAYIEALQERILKVPGVASVYPEIDGVGLLVANGIRSGATLRFVAKDSFAIREDYKKLFKVEAPSAEGTNIEGKGSLPSILGVRDIVIGHKLASTIGASKGDKVRLIAISHTKDGNISAKSLAVKVAGVVSSGYEELDALWVFLPLELASNISGSCTPIIGVKTTRGEDYLGLAALNINNILPSNARAYTYRELNSARFSNLYSTKIMLLFVMFMVVLVACVNISSGLIMLVLERCSEIAILKSMGATKLHIALSFILVGLMAGAIGLLVGLPLGLMLGVNINTVINVLERGLNAFANITLSLKASSSIEHITLLDPAYYLQDIPVCVPYIELFFIALGTLLLSLLAALLPSLKAIRELPSSILHKG